MSKIEQKTSKEISAISSVPIEGEADLGAEIAKAAQTSEIQAAVIIAKKFPRDEGKTREELLGVCELPEFAGSIDNPQEPAAYYSFPRGKKMDKDTGEWTVNIVSGASVRLAREAARIAGNIRHGFFITHDDDESRSIVGFAWDLQKNVPIYASDHFKKLVQRRQAEGGTMWISADERELRELTFRRAAILIRNSILALFPTYLVDQMVKSCKATVSGGGKGTLKERITNMEVAFKEVHRITKSMLEHYLHKPVKECTTEDLEDLRGIFESLKEKLLTPEEHEEMFGAPATTVRQQEGQKLSEARMRPTRGAQPGERRKTEDRTGKRGKKKGEIPGANGKADLLDLIAGAKNERDFFDRVKPEVLGKLKPYGLKGNDFNAVIFSLNEKQHSYKKKR